MRQNIQSKPQSNSTFHADNNCFNLFLKQDYQGKVNLPTVSTPPKN